MRRGQIWLAKLPPANGSIQRGCIRPVILISNNLCLAHSPVVHVIPLTTKNKNNLPTHVDIDTNCGIMIKSTALCEQSMLLCKEFLVKYIGTCDQNTMYKVNDALMVQFGLINMVNNNKVYA